MRSRPPQIGRPILHEPHQATAFVPIPDRSKSPASGSRKKGIDLSRPVTEASCARVESTRVSHRRFADSPGIPRAMVLTAYFVISSVSRAFLPPSQVTMRSIIDRLDISVGISGPHDFAVRANRRGARSSSTPTRPPHPAPNVRDDRETPLSRSAGCESGYSCFYLAVKVNSENPKSICDPNRLQPAKSDNRQFRDYLVTGHIPDTLKRRE